ncbi:MDR family MFS transporter [Deminuibacter soli]|uniref:MFS transporter n=1 Tax=Deminuibacter soli TaxID=2291815 RepID=A0A3E1NIV1_9BACT|nr:MFS transporter [Deminuibacter soli]RFM27863.1 MFS transporter [Deminuibacter soli]
MIRYPLQVYKKAFGGLSAATWYLSVVLFINRSGTMVVPFMTIYATQQLHFSLSQAGLVMAAFGTGAIAGAFAGGKITDAVGFYPVQVAALLLGGVLFMCLGLLHTFPTLSAGAFVLSMCNESFRPANSTAIAHYSSAENRTRSYSLNRFAINLGWACGGALGGFIAGHNYHLLFWVDGGTNILAALLLLKLLPPVKHIRHSKEAKQALQDSSPYRDKIYLWFIVLLTLFATCFMQMFGMQPVFLKTNWHVPEQRIGWLMAENGIMIALFEMIVVYHLENRKRPMYFVCRGMLLISVAYVLLNTLPAVFATSVLVIALITVGEIMCLPFLNSYWITRTQPHNRGSYAALITMAWSTAQVLAPAAGSQLAAWAGFRTLWWVISILCVATAGGMWLLDKRENRYLQELLKL